MNEAIVESPFPQITPELWRLRREPSGLPRLQMSQWGPREVYSILFFCVMGMVNRNACQLELAQSICRS